ncbi:cytochrome P450 2B1-like [Stegodyphus dumicola]|uniref:cytochrome P450 2B1-like n=1 Tax=Stegodyphus dumicola TaxID=202533 RepID=UPI0015AA6733|nr:cytochrome P450 2B1-like [Stegodyphus dumicola]
MKMISDYTQKFLNVPPFTVVVTATVILLSIVYCFMRDRGLPPGPRGMPVLGLYPLLKGEKSYLQLDEYRKTYGDIFSFRLAGQLYINLGSTKIIREVHITKAEYFAARYSGFSLLSFSFNDGVPFLNGEPWKVLRKFFLQVFKDIGMNSLKDNASGPVYDALNSITEDFQNLNGEPIVVIEMLHSKCSNVYRRIMFGENGITEQQMRNFTDPYMAILEHIPTNLLLIGKIPQYVNLFEYCNEVKFLPKRGYSRIITSKRLMENALYDIIDEHEKTFEEDHIRNIIDAYFKERIERRRKGDYTAKYFTKKALMASLAQFVADGLQSVIQLIATFFAALVNHPEEQDKIYREILEVVGPNRQPTLEDKSNLPYTNAFIFEVMRTTDFCPYVPSLECTKDATIKGYRIPKGTITVTNVWSSHHDSEIYEDPYKFDPTRFIAKGNKARPDLPIIFGVGKRVCMGEAFTMIQVFLFLTTIVKNFRLSSPDGKKCESPQYTGKLKICVHPRLPDEKK